MKNGNGMRKAMTSVLVVHPSMTVRTIGELIALATSKPGEFKYASAGVGSSPHLTGELFKQMAGADATASHRNKGFCAARHRLRNTHAELHP